MNPERLRGPHTHRPLIWLLVLVAWTAAASSTRSDASPLQQAQALSAAGDLQAALVLLDLPPPREAFEDSALDSALLRIDLLRRLGRLSQARHALSELQARLTSAPSPGADVQAQLLRQSALLHFQSGELARAREDISAARALAEHLPADLRASLLSDAAIVLPGAPGDRIADFEEAARLAAGRSEEILYRINGARARLEDGRVEDFLQAAQATTRLIEQFPPQTTTAFRLALVSLYRRAINAFGADPGYRLSALNLLRSPAADTALPARLRSLVEGYQAELYADDHQFDIALQYARKALDAAQRAGATDLAWRWEWVLARALDKLAQPGEAIAAYARTTASLARVRSQLELFDQDTLEQVIKPLYYEYASLLLRQSAGITSDNERQLLLVQTRAALEELKLAEVENYFNAQCLGDQEVLLEQVAERTAILYPVLLEDRLELLLTTDTGMHQIAVPVARATLVALVRDFRLNLEADTGTDTYLRQAGQLHELLIRPLEAVLEGQQTDTLVFVPDGPLRTIPLAALHDGERFLVERFALATTPGLTLIEPRPLSGRDYPTLAGGLSESVQGFAALPGVDNELNALASLLDATVLRNQAFTRERIAAELRGGDYSVVHLATHGQFRGSYEDSFLLTHDGRLGIDELGASIQSRAGDRQTPLELLVLSACETAAGDDRAALGLAGVAIRAGARSALATLWEVDDQATQDVVQAFYESLAAGQESRARSLQRAQLNLLRRGDNPHPSQWAPFLLIGNWL